MTFLKEKKQKNKFQWWRFFKISTQQQTTNIKIKTKTQQKYNKHN